MAECLERHLLAKHQCRGSSLRFVAVGLAFLWAVDAVEPDASNKELDQMRALPGGLSYGR